MPTYDYVCTSCGHQIEVVHSVHGHGPTVCTDCGGPMRKAFGAPAVVFKGTGWARKERSGSRSSAKAPSEPKGEESSAKPAPASTPKSGETD